MAFPLGIQDFVYPGPSHLLGLWSLVIYASFVCLHRTVAPQKRDAPLPHQSPTPHPIHVVATGLVILHWSPQSQRHLLLAKPDGKACV